MDTRSPYREYKDALYLRKLATKLTLCSGLFWYLRRRPSLLENSRWERANEAVERFSQRVNDVRHAAARTVKSLNVRECLRQRSLRPLRFLQPMNTDPLIAKPWSLVKMNKLPLLADSVDLKIPRGVITVVVDLDSVFSDISYRQGWRLTKRQFADQLIKFLGRNFELIFWSEEKFPIGQAIVGKWGVASMGVLHADDCSPRGAVAFKDLSRLGRDLSRVVRICTTASSVIPGQEENTILIDPLDSEALRGLSSYFRKVLLHKGDVREKLKELGRDQTAIHREGSSLLNRLVNFLTER